VSLSGLFSGPRRADTACGDAGPPNVLLRRSRHGKVPENFRDFFYVLCPKIHPLVVLLQ